MKRSWVLTAAFALCVVSGVHADVVFNDFGPGDTYTTTVGWGVGDEPSFPYVSSMGFTVAGGTSYSLSEIDFAAFITVGTDSAILSIQADDSGKPGVTLESWAISGMVRGISLHPPESVLSVLHPVLAAGQNYWVTMAPGATDTGAGWALNSIGYQGPVYETRNGAPYISRQDTSSAFRVLGTPTAVPEPSPLVCGGLMALLWACRSRRRAMLSPAGPITTAE